MSNMQKIEEGFESAKKNFQRLLELMLTNMKELAKQLKRLAEISTRLAGTGAQYPVPEEMQKALNENLKKTYNNLSNTVNPLHQPGKPKPR